MPGGHVAKALRLEDLDRVAPGVEMPGHLEMAGGFEVDDERAVGLVLHHLSRMEAKAAGLLGRVEQRKV